MDGALIGQALVKFLAGVALLALLLFVPAGTVHYPPGWLLMAVLFLPMLAGGLWMMFRAPDLLRKRLNAREKEKTQRSIIAASGCMFLCSFVAAGLSFRHSFLLFPPWVSWAGAAIFLLGYALFALVLRENAYLSRTVEVQEGQKVIDTGLYGWVRHPMYSATVLMFLAMPLILRSLLSLLPMLLYPFLIVRRIQNEEQVLLQGLPGYAAYREKVKYRLLPPLW